MIRAAGKGKGGKPFVMLGLDDVNLRRLQQDEPINVNLRHLDPNGEPTTYLPDVNIIIFFADNDSTKVIIESGLRLLEELG